MNKVIDVYFEQYKLIHSYMTALGLLCMKWVKPFAAILLVYAFSINSIVRANYNYIDDLGRVALGYRGWDNFSRYISHYGSILMHTNRSLNDISPLTQYIAVVLLALASVILVARIIEGKTFSWWSVIAVVPLGLSPYFLECLSYKFDSPYMALSVLGSIAPLLFLNSNKVVYCGAVFIGTLIMCTTYQVSSGIFVLCIIFICAKRWNEGEKARNTVTCLIYSIGSYLAGILFFRKLIMKPINVYVSTNIPTNNDLLNTVIRNLSNYYSLLLSDSVRLWLVLFSLICVMFIISFVVGSKRNKFISFGLAIVLLVTGSAISYGGYVILQKSLFAPRGMYGIGTYLALVSLMAVESCRKNYFAKMVSLCIAWTLVVFAFTYGNALAEQKRYTDFRVHMVINDLAKLPDLNNHNIRKMKLNGNIGKSPVVKRMAEKYKILDRLVPTTLGAGWYWSEFYLYNYFELKGVQQVFGGTIEKIDENRLPIFIDSIYHTIKADNKNIVVYFK